MSNSCKTFENILNQINEKGISSKEELMLYPELYSQYWSAAEVFANYCLASKANEANMETLKKYGITTYDDIKQDSIIKLITILDSMFFLKDKNKNIIKRRSTKHQYNYAYTCVNHLVNDQFEKLPPEGIKIIPLEGTVTNNYSNEDSDTTYSEIIGDDRYNGEHIYLENENIKELKGRGTLQIKKGMLVVSMKCLAARGSAYLKTAGNHLAFVQGFGRGTRNDVNLREENGDTYLTWCGLIFKKK